LNDAYLNWRQVETIGLHCMSQRPLWNIMEHYGTLWNIMEHYGTLWNIMEHYGTLWNIPCTLLLKEN